MKLPDHNCPVPRSPSKAKGRSVVLLVAMACCGGLCLGSGVAYAQGPGGAPSLAPKGKAAGKKKAAAKTTAQDEDLGGQAAPARVQPIVIVRPEEMDEKSLSGRYQYFLGSLHAHSVYSGDHAKGVATKFNNGVADYQRHTPAEVWAKARTNSYDFYFITDHSSPEQNEFYQNGFTEAHWAATRQQAAAATTDRFVALRGYEFSRNVDPDNGGSGHMNVLNSPAWNSAYSAGHTFNWLYDWLTPQTNAPVVAQFNHPQMPGLPKGKHFKNYAGRTRERNEVVRFAEIWNSSENMNYVATVRKIWALGWKVAPTAGPDVHGPFGVENKRLRTGLLAEQLTAAAIMQALKARRVYATLEPKLHLEFTLNGFMMGTSLDRRPPGDLKARVFVNDPAGSVISRVEVHGGKYEANGGANERVSAIPVGQGKKIVEGSVPGGYDYYYVAVFKEGVDTARAFTSPIWMDDK